MKLSELKGIISDEVSKLLENKDGEKKSDSLITPLIKNSSDENAKKDKDNKNEYYRIEYFAIPMKNIKEHGHYCEFDLACNIARKYKNMYGEEEAFQYIGVSGQGSKFAIMHITQMFLDKLEESWFLDKKHFNKFKECGKKYLDLKENKEIIESY